MSDQTHTRRSGFDALWPFPGVVLAMLLAAWFVYMGLSAAVEDIKTAFIGLGGVTALIALFGLRAANLGARGRERAERAKAGIGGPRRSSIPDPAGDTDGESGKTWAPPAAADTEPTGTDAAPREARANLRKAAAAEAIAHADALEDEAETLAREGGGGMGAGAGATSGSVVPAPRRHHGRPADLEEVADALDELMAMINRETAERGAAIARITGRAEAGEAEGRESSVGLEERLNRYLTIPAFNNAMNQRVFPQVGQMIEKALAEKIGPEALKAKVNEAAKTAETDPEAPVTFALQLAEARQALEAHVEEAQKDRKALREQLRNVRQMAERAARVVDTRVDDGKAGERDLLTLVQELRAGRRADRERLLALEAALASRTAADAAAASQGGGEDAESPAPAAPEAALSERIDALARQTHKRLDALSAAVERATENGDASEDGETPKGPRRQLQALRRDIDEVRSGVEQRFAGLDAAVGELRTASQRMAQQIELAQTAQLRIADRLEALAGPAQSSDADDASGQPSVREEVDALRSALTTIIEQNRAIRAQQDMLSARFDPPGHRSGS